MPLTDDDTGKLIHSGIEVDVTLAGAQLIDLSLARRIELDDRQRIVVADSSSTGDPELDQALTILAERAATA